MVTFFDTRGIDAMVIFCQQTHFIHLLDNMYFKQGEKKRNAARWPFFQHKNNARLFKLGADGGGSTRRMKFGRMKKNAAAAWAFPVSGQNCAQ